MCVFYVFGLKFAPISDSTVMLCDIVRLTFLTLVTLTVTVTLKIVYCTVDTVTVRVCALHMISVQ